MQIINPINGETIDMMPLLEMMADESLSLRGPQNVIRRLQVAHDFISTHPPSSGNPNELEAFRLINYGLIELRKAFEKMETRPSETQQQPDRLV